MALGVKRLGFLQCSHGVRVWEFKKHYSRSSALHWRAVPRKDSKSPYLYILS